MNAVLGQDEGKLKNTYFFKENQKKLSIETILLLENVVKVCRQEKFGDRIADEYLQENFKKQ